MQRCLALLLAAACASSQPQPSREVVPPGVNVPADGSRLIFSGQAEGAQVYACSPKAGGGQEWKLKAPDAEVTDSTGAKLRHFAGPTWEAADGSAVVGEVKARAEVDAAAIPWLLLGAKSTSGAGLLTQVRWIQRLETRGGKAPGGNCDAGAEARVPYSATYNFWAP
jgi:hypothetical protein